MRLTALDAVRKEETSHSFFCSCTRTLLALDGVVKHSKKEEKKKRI
jgi:hypothetical protein